jgi:hypothetical protein
VGDAVGKRHCLFQEGGRNRQSNRHDFPSELHRKAVYSESYIGVMGQAMQFLDEGAQFEGLVKRWDARKVRASFQESRESRW